MSTETKLPPTIPKAAGAANAQNLNHAIENRISPNSLSPNSHCDVR
jgi:hypothetical protein